MPTVLLSGLTWQGRETEQNWLLREKSVMRVRGMLKGNAHQQYREGFLAGLRAGMWEGLLKTACLYRLNPRLS